MHGLSFNINSNLDYFKNIVPCGIDDKDVTSIERELGRKVDLNEVQKILQRACVAECNASEEALDSWHNMFRHDVWRHIRRFSIAGSQRSNHLEIGKCPSMPSFVPVLVVASCRVICLQDVLHGCKPEM